MSGAGFLIRVDGRSADWLAATRQPGRSAGLLVWLDGFIAEPGRLARELDVADPAPEALLAHAWRRWGDQLQAHVLGEYAAAIVDPRERRLFATGDALGLRPVYWRRLPAGVVAASDLAAVVGTLESVEVDETYVATHLLSAGHRPDATPYRLVRRLAPGHSLAVDAEGVARGRQTWRLADAPPLAEADPDAVEEQFRATLDRAIAAHLDTPAATLSELSGGLDSSTIAAVAWRRGCNARPRALVSVTYGVSADADERPWMDALLAQCPYRSLRLDGDDHAPFSMFPAAFVAAPGTAISFAALAKAYEATATAEGASIVLSGNGGDHVLMGEAPPPLFMADDLATGRWGAMLSAARAWGEAGERRSVGYHLTNHALRPLIARLAGRTVTPSTLPRTPPWLSPRLARLGASSGLRSASEGMRAARTVAEQQFIERVASFSDTAGHNFQGNVRAFAYRYPLLFVPLVELLFRTPVAQLARPGVDRRLHRRALRGILPEPIRLRRGKRGPDAAVFRGLRANREWLDLLSHEPRLVAEGYVEPQAWSRVVEIAAAGHMQLISLFLQAATLEYWLRNLALRPRHTHVMAVSLERPYEDALG